MYHNNMNERALFARHPVRAKTATALLDFFLLFIGNLFSVCFFFFLFFATFKGVNIHKMCVTTANKIIICPMA